MRNILKNSLFIGILFKVLMTAKLCYDNSRTREAAESIALSYANSRTRAAAEKYLDKKPYFEHSLFCMGVRKIFGYINALCEEIFGLWQKIYKGGITEKEIKSLAELNIKTILIFVSLFLSTVTLGYLAGTVITGGDMEVCSVISSVGFFAALVILSAGQNLNIIKNSIFCKAIAFLFK